MLGDAEKQMKSLQRRYKDDHDQEVLNAPLSFTARKTNYLDRPSMTTSVAERLMTKSCNKLMPPKKKPCKVIHGSPMTIMIDEDEIRNTVSIDRATLLASVKFAERQIRYPPDEPFDKTDDKFDEGGGEPTGEVLTDAPCEDAVDPLAQNVSEGH